MNTQPTESVLKNHVCMVSGTSPKGDYTGEVADALTSNTSQLLRELAYDFNVYINHNCLSSTSEANMCERQRYTSSNAVDGEVAN